MRSPALNVEKLMFNNIGLPGLLLIAVVVLVLFGRGKISSLMGEVGKGITSFKKGISEGDDETKKGTDDTAELSDDSTVATEIKTDKDKV
jgi:sec-independent protein translocase protein TatA